MESTHHADANETASKDQPLDAGFLPDEFGIVLPDESGLSVRKQAGMSCRQLRVNGWFLPLKHPHVNCGYPDWFPNAAGTLSPDGPHPVTEYDLETIPDRDFQSLPEWVKARDPVTFYNFEEFSYWLNTVWFYGHRDLIDEVRKWKYDPSGTLLDRTMTDAWDSLDDIWAAIDSKLTFTYDEFNYLQEQLDSIRSDTEIDFPLDPDTHQTPSEGIKWITITGSKYRNGTPTCPWAEQLEGETVMLLYPNCE